MAQPSETEAVNADSFLDIVASIVSIMIIMVLMTGLKIRHAPVDAAEIEAAGRRTTTPLLARAGRRAGRCAATSSAWPARSARSSSRRSSACKNATWWTRRCGPWTCEVQSARTPGRRPRAAGRAAGRPAGRGPAPPGGSRAAAAGDRRGAGHADRKLSHAAGPDGGRPRAALPASRRADRLHPAGRCCWRASRPTPSARSTSWPTQPEFTDTVGPEGGFRLRYTLERHEVTARRPAGTAAPGPTSA